MSTRTIKCESKRVMEYVFSEMQEIYSHVEFLHYDGRRLTIAYIY